MVFPPIKLYLSSKKPTSISCIIFYLGLGIYAAWERKFWRPGDKKRIPILRSGFCINSIIHYKDEFYGIDPFPHHSYVNGEIEQFFVQLEFRSSSPGIKRIPTKINRPQYMSTNHASQFLVESLCGTSCWFVRLGHILIASGGSRCTNWIGRRVNGRRLQV